MLFDMFFRDQRGSAVRWFAYAAVAITVVAAIGAHGLAWVAESGRLPVIAFVPLSERTIKVQPPGGVDMEATGSIRRSVLDMPNRSGSALPGH